MLVIHPDECIDCGVCVPECPVDAIKPDTEPGLEKWLSLNAEYAKIWPNIPVKKSPRPTLRSGRRSPTNSNTSRQIPARVIDAAYVGFWHLCDMAQWSKEGRLRLGSGNSRAATDQCSLTSTRPRSNMKLNPQDLEKITDLTLDHYNERAEDFWKARAITTSTRTSLRCYNASRVNRLLRY